MLRLINLFFCVILVVAGCRSRQAGEGSDSQAITGSEDPMQKEKKIITAQWSDDIRRVSVSAGAVVCQRDGRNARTIKEQGKQFIQFWNLTKDPSSQIVSQKILWLFEVNVQQTRPGTTALVNLSFNDVDENLRFLENVKGAPIVSYAFDTSKEVVYTCQDGKQDKFPLLVSMTWRNEPEDRVETYNFK